MDGDEEEASKKGESGKVHDLEIHGAITQNTTRTSLERMSIDLNRRRIRECEEVGQYEKIK